MSRKLGPHETYGAVRSKLGSYTNVVVSARLHKPASKQAAFFAVGQLLQNEPLLGVTISGEEGSFEMTKMEKALVSNFFDLSVYDKALRQAQEELHYVSLDLSKGHWKVYLLDCGKEILFLYDHALLDGMSGAFAIEQLVQSVDEFYRLGIKHVDDIVYTSYEDLPPPIEEQIKVSVPISRLIKELANEYLFSKPPTSLPRQVVPWSSYYAIVDFSDSETAAFLKMCKKNGFSGGAGLYALIVCGSAEVLHSKYPDAVTRPVRGLVPYNARNFTKKGKFNPKRLGMLVGESILYTRVPGPEEVAGATPTAAFLEVARQYQRVIKRDTKRTWFSGYPFMHVVGLIPYVHSLNDFFRKHNNNHPRGGMFAMSNLTAFDMPVERLRFTQCTGGTSPFIQFSVVGLRNGSISISIAVADDSTVVGEVEHYVKKFARNL